MAPPKSLTPLSCNPPLLYLYINEIPSQSSFLQNRQAQHLQSLLMHTDAPDSKLSSWPLMDSLQHMYSDCKCVQRFRGNSQHTSLVAPRSPPSQHPPPRVAHHVRGAHTALPSPSATSQRWFRFPRRSGLPSPPSGPSQPHGRARQAPRGSGALGSPPEMPGRPDPAGRGNRARVSRSHGPHGYPGRGLASPRPARALRWARAEPWPRPLRHSPPALRLRSAAAAPVAGGGRAGKRGLAAGGAARCRQHGSVQPCPGAAAVPRPAAGEPALQQLQLQVRGRAPGAAGAGLPAEAWGPGGAWGRGAGEPRPREEPSRVLQRQRDRHRAWARLRARGMDTARTLCRAPLPQKHQGMGYSEEGTGQDRTGIVVTLSLKYLCWVWAPLCKKDKELLEKVHWSATKMRKRLEHPSFEERLWKLGMFSLEKGILRGELINACKFLGGGCHEDGVRLFSGVRQQDEKQRP